MQRTNTRCTDPNGNYSQTSHKTLPCLCKCLSDSNIDNPMPQHERGEHMHNQQLLLKSPMPADPWVQKGAEATNDHWPLPQHTLLHVLNALRCTFDNHAKRMMPWYTSKICTCHKQTHTCTSQKIMTISNKNNTKKRRKMKRTQNNEQTRKGHASKCAMAKHCPQQQMLHSCATRHAWPSQNKMNHGQHAFETKTAKTASLLANAPSYTPIKHAVNSAHHCDTNRMTATQNSAEKLNDTTGVTTSIAAKAYRSAQQMKKQLEQDSWGCWASSEPSCP